MTCHDFEKVVLSLARGDLLDPDAAHQGLAHAGDCPDCSVRLAEERALAVGVRATVAEMAARQAPPTLEAKLLAAFRNQHDAPAARDARLMRSQMRHIPNWLLATAAALILTLVGAVIILRHQLRQQTGDLQVTAESGGSRDVASTADPLPQPGAGDTAPGNDNDHPRKASSGRVPRATESDDEETTEFFALTDGDDLNSLESGEIVRVELPASALLAAGLAAADLETDGTVRADVILGQDGLAHAIRFVR